ncbi:hypothetical protein TrVE_jg13675 [Triparma verrucosa]|uniref:Uncharacterized protein n=1 Tax=Triparma verrucosa TaxID=1606542 RepID=A0A9W7F021_9STRA|nr:hypothetical protein TrVE_jg13675 [Triparma verrucosa]
MNQKSKSAADNADNKVTKEAPAPIAPGPVDAKATPDICLPPLTSLTPDPVAANKATAPLTPGPVPAASIGNIFSPLLNSLTPTSRNNQIIRTEKVTREKQEKLKSFAEGIEKADQDLKMMQLEHDSCMQEQKLLELACEIKKKLSISLNESAKQLSIVLPDDLKRATERIEQHQAMDLETMQQISEETRVKIANTFLMNEALKDENAEIEKTLKMLSQQLQKKKNQYEEK